MDYLTTTELSNRWGISARRIGILCSEGRLTEMPAEILM